MSAAAVSLAPWRRIAPDLPPKDDSRLFASSFASLFSDRRGAREIGRRYLAQFPEESDPRRLEANLLRREDRLSAARMRARLAERRRNDFAAGRTVLINGWILAQSEVRACALLAVLPRG